MKDPWSETGGSVGAEILPPYEAREVEVSKRWSGGTEVEVPEVDAFLAEVIAVCRKHGLSISHEDHHGAFEIEPFDEEHAAWLEEAAWCPKP